MQKKKKEAFWCNEIHEYHDEYNFLQRTSP
jgi:hypothetical protein